MPLKSTSIPATINFFTSPAWADLHALIEAQKPEWPTINADALLTAAKARQREGYEMCLAVLMREAGTTAPLPNLPQDAGQPVAPTDPMQKAMDELVKDGEFINTHTD